MLIVKIKEIKEREKLSDTLRVLVQEIVLGIFLWEKKRTINCFTIFYIFHRTGMKTYPKGSINNALSVRRGCAHERNMGIFRMRLDFCVWYFLAIQYLMLLVKGLVAELTPPHEQNAQGFRRESDRAMGFQQHIVIIFPKKNCYAIEIGLLFSLMIWRFLTIGFMMLIGFDFM